MRLDFWFDLSCPYAYLASQRLPEVVSGRTVTLRYQPMLLGGVFRAIGAGDGPMATLSAAKRAHLAQDLARWADVAGAPLVTPAGHPMRTVRALRTLLGLPEPSWPAAVHQLYAAYWQRSEDVADDAVIEAALRRAGLTQAAIDAALAGADSPARKDDLRARTDHAVALGIFGAPAFFIDDERGGEPLFLWGQDRLAWVSAALDGWRPPHVAPAAHDDLSRDAPSRARTIDFYFDVASPFAYLGLTQIARVAHGHDLRLRPLLLGGLFRAIGTPDVPLMTFPAAKRAYVMREIGTWAAWWAQPFAFPSRFPQRTLTAQRMIVAAEPAQKLPLAIALARAMWAHGQSLEDEQVLAEAARTVGASADLVEAAKAPEIKAALSANTEAAAARGVFGVPTCVIDPDTAPKLYWGQDRLTLVARELAKR